MATGGFRKVLVRKLHNAIYKEQTHYDPNKNTKRLEENAWI